MQVFIGIVEIKLDFDLIWNTPPILYLLPSPPPITHTQPTLRLLIRMSYKVLFSLQYF